jgi:hypothetical protein
MKISSFVNELISGKRGIKNASHELLTAQHLINAELHDVGEQYLARSNMPKLLQQLEQQRHNPAAVALAIAVCGHLAQQGVTVRKMTPNEYITEQLLPTLHETGNHADLIRTYIADIQRAMRD